MLFGPLYVDVSERVRAGVHAGGAGPGHQATQEAAPIRGGGRAAEQAHGLLQQGGPLVRGEGRHDQLRQAQDPRA